MRGSCEISIISYEDHSKYTWSILKTYILSFRDYVAVELTNFLCVVLIYLFRVKDVFILVKISTNTRFHINGTVDKFEFHRHIQYS